MDWLKFDNNQANQEDEGKQPDAAEVEARPESELVENPSPFVFDVTSPAQSIGLVKTPKGTLKLQSTSVVQISKANPFSLAR